MIPKRAALRLMVVLGALAAAHGRAANAAAAPVRLAVMELATAGKAPELEGLGAGLQSMITTDLANASGLVLVERARLHDVVSELRLGQSRFVDAATAAKLGKVVGATHLLTGSVTLAGAKMRIDARLVEVATGRVLLGESIDGQADVFFELEKALVRKLVDAVAVQVTPKERGAMAKIQTADFEAFRKYGAGLKLFDDKKYEPALKALREASERDAEFGLARTTLAEYERIVAGLRREADGIEQQRAVEAEQQLGKELNEEQAVLRRMFEAAGRRGEAARDTRLTALYLLARDYQARRLKLAEEEDRFAWERTTDAIFQRYVAESMTAFPRVPALVNNFDEQGWWKIKYPQPATFAADLDRLAGELKDFGVRTRDKRDEESARGFHRQRSLTVDRRENFERLHLDARAQADMEDRLDALLEKTDPEYLRKNPESVLHRAELRGALLDLDASTKLLVGLRRNKEDPAWLRKLADLTEANARIKELAAKHGGAPAWRESIMLWLARNGTTPGMVNNLDEDLGRDFTAGGALTATGASDLTHARQFQGSQNIHGMVLIGEHPFWNVEGEPWTGPRRDPMRADELRYFGEPAARNPRRHFTLLIADGVPRREVRARFQLVSGGPPADFRPQGYDYRRRGEDVAVPGVDGGRPVVTFLFGARDIARTLRREADERGGYPRLAPMRALGVRFERGRAVLVDVTRAAYEEHHNPDDLKLTMTPLATHALGGAGAAGALPLDVSVAVDGKRAHVSVGGEAFDLPIEHPEPGFYGFIFEEPGYMAVRQLAIEGGGGRLAGAP
jgi:TolB-like protein